MLYFRLIAVFCCAAISLTGCGTYTPDKDPLVKDVPEATGLRSPQGTYEDKIVQHVLCELGEGVQSVMAVNPLPWFEKWGTTVTQTITVEDQTGVSPGLSLINPLQNVIKSFPTGGNVTLPESYATSLGATASANAIRTETVQYTFRNIDLIKYTSGGPCKDKQKGFFIDGDLKIKEFIFDKAEIAKMGNATLVPSPEAWKLPVFNTFTEEITFVAAFGGSATPTWKLARVSANASSNLLVSERTNTNDLIITLGPLKCSDAQKDKKTGICNAPLDSPVQLVDAAQNQHNARVTASALATSIIGQSH